jgi:cobalt-zinc-cadmium efflux system membrane fusion protein
VTEGPASIPRRDRGTRSIAAALVALTCVALLGFVVAKRSRAVVSSQTEVESGVPHVEGRNVVFSSAFGERVGLKTEPVRRSRLTPVVSVPGAVTFDAQHVSAAGTRIRGFVRQVFKVEGDVVRKGEALAEIESGELGNAQAEIAAIAAKKRAAERNASRESDLLAQGLTTAREEEVARAELEQQTAMLAAASQRAAALGGATARGLGTYLVHSPMDGTVVRRSISAGQSVDADLIAFEIADLKYLWIELHVFEREIGNLRLGDRAEITPAGAGQQKLEGKVAYVGQVIDMSTRSGEVRLKAENAAGLLRPGQSVFARVHPALLAREALSVPMSAITYVDGRPHVFVGPRAEDGGSLTRVRVVQVKVGMNDGDRQEIVEGLVEGDDVVVAGVFALKSELFR